MLVIPSKIYNKDNFINLLFSAIPLSFIAGNLIINLNIFLIILFSFVFYGVNIFKIKIKLIDKLVIIFFLFVLYTSIYNNIFIYITEDWPKNFSVTKKAFLFLRFLAFYFIIRFLILEEKINFKIFLISCTVCSIFVSLDLFYQFIFGVDIFGFESSGRKLSGPFGDELIAGGYLQRFSIFSFFLFPLYFIKSKKYLKYIYILLILLFFPAIIISGNRMPLILFTFAISLIMLLEKDLRKYFVIFFISISIIFVLLFKFNPKIKANFISFYNQITKMTTVISSSQIDKAKMPPYYKEFSTFYETWKMNKYIGGGIKGFRYYCHKRQNIEKNAKFICNMHPHNYYLEILSELGLVGFLIVSSFFLISLYMTIVKKYFLTSHLNNSLIITPFMFLALLEIFPIKSTGSFFTTGNATYIFLVISVSLALSIKKN
tara:strand:- start:2609 stop:3901 length:1293 start_codon:yes stop_codon:yes gene_type:complete